MATITNSATFTLDSQSHDPMIISSVNVYRLESGSVRIIFNAQNNKDSQTILDCLNDLNIGAEISEGNCNAVFLREPDNEVANICLALGKLEAEKLLAPELCKKITDNFPGNTPGFIDARLSAKNFSAAVDYYNEKSALRSVIEAQDREILDLVLNRRDSILNAPKNLESEITKPDMIDYSMPANRQVVNSSPVLFKGTDCRNPYNFLAVARQDAQRITRKLETSITTITEEVMGEMNWDLSIDNARTNVRDLPFTGFVSSNK